MATQQILKVRSVPIRFRRAGLSFTTTATTLKVADLSEEQITALKSEPNLVVSESTETIEVSSPDAINADSQKETSSPENATPVTAAEVASHIGLLNVDVADNWTTGGKPQVAVLESALGVKISASLRDEAFDLYQAQQIEGTDH